MVARRTEQFQPASNRDIASIVPAGQFNGTSELPDLRGLSAREALRVLTRIGLAARLTGTGIVTVANAGRGFRHRSRRHLRAAARTRAPGCGGCRRKPRVWDAMKLSRLLKALERQVKRARQERGPQTRRPRAGLRLPPGGEGRSVHRAQGVESERLGLRGRRDTARRRGGGVRFAGIGPRHRAVGGGGRRQGRDGRAVGRILRASEPRDVRGRHHGHQRQDHHRVSAARVVRGGRHEIRDAGHGHLHGGR